MGATRDQTVFMASLPSVGQVDAVEECIIVDFGSIIDTLVVDTTVVIGKSVLYQ